LRGGRTLLAALAAWLLYRVVRRGVKVALLVGVLAAGIGFVHGRGVNLSGPERVATCEIPALISAVAQLPQLLAESATGARDQAPRPAAKLTRCEPNGTPTQRPRGPRR
jgi:hypothetical protein